VKNIKKAQQLQDKVNQLEAENERLNRDLELKNPDRWFNLSQDDLKNVKQDIHSKSSKLVNKEQQSRQRFEQSLLTATQNEDNARKILDEKIEQQKKLIDEYSHALVEERKRNKEGHDVLSSELATKHKYIDYLFTRIGDVESRNEKLEMKLSENSNNNYTPQDNVSSTGSSQDLGNGDNLQVEDEEQPPPPQGNKGNFWKTRQHNNYYHQYPQQSPRNNTSPRYNTYNNNNNNNPNDMNGNNRNRPKRSYSNRGKKQMQNNNNNPDPPNTQSPPPQNQQNTTNKQPTTTNTDSKTPQNVPLK